METTTISPNKGKILLVEDDEFLNEIYTLKFKTAGFDVKTAKNGKDGLEILSEFMPDLAIIDLIMPEMDGFAFLHKLRENPKTEQIKVVILTNVIPEDGLQKAAQYGVVDYIVKSDMRAGNIVDKVEKILNS